MSQRVMAIAKFNTFVTEVCFLYMVSRIAIAEWYCTSISNLNVKFKRLEASLLIQKNIVSRRMKKERALLVSIWWKKKPLLVNKQVGMVLLQQRIINISSLYGTDQFFITFCRPNIMINMVPWIIPST